MNALINARSQLGGETADSPLSDGLASNALPEARSSQTGVSVEYVQSATESDASSSITPPMTMPRNCNGLCFVSLTDVLSKHQIF